MTLTEMLMPVAPELTLLIGVCAVFLLGVSKRPAVRSAIAPLTLVILLGSLVATAMCSDLDASGLVGLAFDELTGYVRWITLAMGVLLLLVNWRVPTDGEQGEYFGLMLCSIAGVLLTASANDLVVLFFAIELVSVPTYVMVALSRTDQRASEAALKYFFLGALSAAVMVYGFSFLYGLAGTTTMMASGGDSLQATFAEVGAINAFAVVGLLLAMAGLSFKVAVVPFHAYAPDVYEGAASPLTGLLGFLPKLAGFVALIRLLTVCHWALPDSLMWMMWIMAVATMIFGNVLALLQTNVKRILAYSSISHSGYMMIGLLVGPVLGEGPMHDGVAAVLFYIVIYGLMNLGAFAVLSGLNVRGEAAETLDDLAGLSRRAPMMAIAMAVCAFSLMGFPPTAGFLGKVYIFSSAFSLSDAHPFHGPLVTLAVIGVINSAIGAVYYLRIAGYCFLREPGDGLKRVGGVMPGLGLAVCSLAMIVLFIRPTDLVNRAKSATASVGSSVVTRVAVAGAETPPSDTRPQ